ETLKFFPSTRVLHTAFPSCSCWTRIQNVPTIHPKGRGGPEVSLHQCARGSTMIERVGHDPISAGPRQTQAGGVHDEEHGSPRGPENGRNGAARRGAAGQGVRGRTPAGCDQRAIEISQPGGGEAAGPWPAGDRLLLRQPVRPERASRVAARNARIHGDIPL